MERLKSRKLWVAIGTILSVVLVHTGIEEAVADKLTNAIVNVVMIYIGSQAVVDAAAAFRGYEES